MGGFEKCINVSVQVYLNGAFEDTKLAGTPHHMWQEVEMIPHAPVRIDWETWRYRQSSWFHGHPMLGFVWMKWSIYLPNRNNSEQFTAGRSGSAISCALVLFLCLEWWPAMLLLARVQFYLEMKLIWNICQKISQCASFMTVYWCFHLFLVMFLHSEILVWCDHVWQIWQSSVNKQE